MKKALIITYRYAPLNVIGAVRMTKFVKYLPEFGWEPIVFTVEPRSSLYLSAGELQDEMSTGKVFRTKDYSLNELLFHFYSKLKGRPIKESQESSESQISGEGSSRLKSLLVSLYKKFICFPDDCILWRLFGMRELNKIIKRENPDVIFSSSLPNTVHLMASRATKIHNIPWVADFRDLWTQNYLYNRPPLLRNLESVLEDRVMNRASALTTVSSGLQRQLRDKHGAIVHVIPNGFDPDDLELVSENQQQDTSDRFTLTFTGTIYPEMIDSMPVFVALESLLKQGLVSQDQISVKFYGRNQDHIRSLINRRFRNLSKIVELNGWVSREEALRQQLKASALLLLIPNWNDPVSKGVVTGKVFEYLAAKKPILSIGPSGGDLEELITCTNGGFHGTAIEEIEQVLLQWIDQFRQYGKVQIESNEREIQRYSRKAQTEELAKIFEQVVENEN